MRLGGLRPSAPPKTQPTGGLCTHTTTRRLHLSHLPDTYHLISSSLFVASLRCFSKSFRFANPCVKRDLQLRDEMSAIELSFVGARTNKRGPSCRTAPDKTRARFNRHIFPYIKLDSNLKEIRVLEVAPGTGFNAVTCTLKHISLLDDKVPCYETISYCWGSTGAKKIIRLNGSLIWVPSSSEAAVRRMRFSDKPRVLWIDAICIDQSSQSEKGEQVAFMSTIYSTAKQNLVYLGEDDAGSAERAAKSVQSLVSEMRAEVGDVEALFDTLHSRKREGSISIKEFNPDVNFSALERLFNLAWFT
jgi:hypothetical protein